MPYNAIFSYSILSYPCHVSSDWNRHQIHVYDANGAFTSLYEAITYELIEWEMVEGCVINSTSK